MSVHSVTVTRGALGACLLVLVAIVALLSLASVGYAGAIVQGGHGRAERLTGTSERDLILAGRGDDVIFARDRRKDYVNCGPGFDRAILDRIDRAYGCERKRYPPTSALIWPPFLVGPKLIHPAVYAGAPGSVDPLPPAVARQTPASAALVYRIHGPGR